MPEDEWHSGFAVGQECIWEKKKMDDAVEAFQASTDLGSINDSADDTEFHKDPLSHHYSTTDCYWAQIRAKQTTTALGLFFSSFGST